ncbi:pirin family protein [Hugenholtzia roseola]|uniref:pirin family protein n=1 Tax=Hugenholtzia roseola TaxID=1002 RepID=UPI0004255A79|nr:pirin family protein [Hugenholtzia roseola]
MQTLLHKAQTRGSANHGWLQANHTFSFASYRDPSRMHFGVLRVLNDDLIAGGGGFGTHPHDNMEIITIPLKGALAHKDSMGNASVIHAGDVQVMSAGTGVYHSEFNHYPDKECNLLQIWLFPNQRNVAPRYQQISFGEKLLHNQLNQILSPSEKDEGVWIYQNAYFHLGKFNVGTNFSYTLKDPANNGLYAFLIEGQMQVKAQDQTLDLHKRDGAGFWETTQTPLEFKALADSHILLMEVPMAL